MALLEAGNAKRTTSATAMNRDSSRSHAALILTVDDGRGSATQVTLVDLAGSERTRKSGAASRGRESQMKEACAINSSLQTLGRCVAALAARKKHQDDGGQGAAPPAPPFRDSPLTWLLREALAGDSRTWMLACVNPSDAQQIETTSTLRYAATARSLRTRARVNEDPIAALIKSLRAEVGALRAQLASRGGPALAPDRGLPSLLASLRFLDAADDVCGEVAGDDDS